MNLIKLKINGKVHDCLLYTSDAADERSSVDLGGRRIIKKKQQEERKWDVVVGENIRYTTRGSYNRVTINDNT